LSPLTTLKAVAILVVALALGACSSGDGNTVAMQSGQRFEPEVLTVDAGQTVTFVNESEDAHTVTAYENEIPETASYFSSGGFVNENEARDDLAGGLLSEGEKFDVRFEMPGTYQYFCIPHEDSGMTGRIVVEQ
jgi:plastocyanin